MSVLETLWQCDRCGDEGYSPDGSTELPAEWCAVTWMDDQRSDVELCDFCAEDLLRWLNAGPTPLEIARRAAALADNGPPRGEGEAN